MTYLPNDSVFASDHDRDVACEQLAVAAGEGRITPDEHEEWVERALKTRTRGDLRRLIENLPNPKLPDLPARRDTRQATAYKTTPPRKKALCRRTHRGFQPHVDFILIASVFLFCLFRFSYTWGSTNAPAIANPTPAAAITDPQDRAFVQSMIDYHNLYGDPDHPTDVDEAAVLEIAHTLRNPANDIRQHFLLIMNSTAYKGLTSDEKYHAGKLALSIWRPDQESTWVALGKDQRLE